MKFSLSHIFHYIKNTECLCESYRAPGIEELSEGEEATANVRKFFLCNITSRGIREQTRVEDHIMERTWTMESHKLVFKIFLQILLIHKMSLLVTPAS